MEAAGTVPERRPSRTDIYGYLYRTTGFCSRQRISEDLGLSLPTVYQALSELMELGLIRTSGEQKASRGRRPQGLEIVPDARFAIGVSLTEDRLRLSAVDLRLSELAHARIPLDSSLPFSELGPLLARELEAFLESAGLERERLLGVGIALPAVLDAEARRVVLAPTLSFRNLSLDDLTSPLPYPTQPFSPAELPTWGTTGAAESSGTCAWNPAGAAAVADAWAAWKPSAPPGASKRRPASPWTSSLKKSGSTARNTSCSGTICFATSPSGSATSAWPWTATWCWAECSPSTCLLSCPG